MGAIPVAVQEIILSFLPPTELCRIAVVCKAWKEISTSENLWKALMLREKKEETPEKQEGNLKQAYIRQELGKLWASVSSKSLVMPTIVHTGNAGICCWLGVLL